MRFLGIDKDDWVVIAIIVVFLILLAIVSFLFPGINLWGEWLSSVWS